MSTSVRKGGSHIYIEYINGGYTSSLSGKNFIVHETNEELNFEIDLSGNYKVQNKSTNSYLDINELSESYGKLKYIQIDNDKILRSLSASKSRNPRASWLLTLNAGKLGSFTYAVKPEKYSMGYQFNVINV